MCPAVKCIVVRHKAITQTTSLAGPCTSRASSAKGLALAIHKGEECSYLPIHLLIGEAHVKTCSGEFLVYSELHVPSAPVQTCIMTVPIVVYVQHIMLSVSISCKARGSFGTSETIVSVLISE